jgi:hypothetical protein
MKSQFVSCLAVALLSMPVAALGPKITIESMLNEMVDRQAISKFPSPTYRCLQASSYNRESVSPDLPGWFADSDGVSCIRTEEINGTTEWVLMEDDGPGCITRLWAVCFYYGLGNTTGANIKVFLDGAAEPVIHTNFFRLVQGQDFIKPPFADSTARAGNLYFPIPYARHCKITMDQRVFYNIINYRKYPQGTSVKTFTMADFHASETLRNQVAAAWMACTDGQGDTVEKKQIIESGTTLSIDLPQGPHAVTQLEIRLKNKTHLPDLLRSVVLVGTFDGTQTLWVPVGDFFCSVGKQRPYQMWERSVREDGTMVCRWVMPYQTHGRLSLKNLGQTPAEVQIKVVTDRYPWDQNSMHFYATWRMDDPYPTFPIFDWNFLEAKGKGVIVGDEWTVLNPSQGWWGEGDEKIYVDDDFDRKFPSHFGTGTEDYYGWAGGVVPTPKDEFSKPFLGNIIVGEQKSMGYNVCTRTRVLDAIPFQHRIKFDMEASCGTRSTSFFLQYAQTTYWYARPGVTHNRPPLPRMAAMALPQLKDLQDRIASARKTQYTARGAIEAELYTLTAQSDSVRENLEDIPVWGDISHGAMKNLWFEHPGDFADIKITEQFETSTLQMCAAVGQVCGVFDIYVNGVRKVSQDFCTDHAGMTTPLIRLGRNDPVDNAFTIRFVYQGKSARARSDRKAYALGIDYFLLQNDFMTEK